MERQVLIFRLAENRYAVDIARVREIIPFTKATRVPRSPRYVEGVINLRGHIVTVVHLAKRFGVGTDADEYAHIIVMDQGEEVVGLLVNAVVEVKKINEEQVEQLPVSDSEAIEALEGIAKIEDQLVILLDLDKLLDKDRLT